MKTLKQIIGLMALCALTACNTDELCYVHPHQDEFTVRFDFSVSTDLGEEIPESMTGMRLSFYNDGGRVTTLDLPLSGAKVRLTPGTYHLVTHNNNTEWITFDGGDFFNTHVATTRTADILEPMFGGMGRVKSEVDLGNGERVAVAPEPLWAAGLEGVEIHAGDEVVLKPQPLHCLYTFEFRNVGNVATIDRMCAAITGMAGGVAFATGKHTDETVTIPLECKPGPDGNSIIGQFYTYGHNAELQTIHRMALFLVMTDGNQYKITDEDCLDVTEQVHSAADRRHVNIVVDGLTLPTPQRTSTDSNYGFTIGTQDWGDVNTVISM